MPTVQIHANFHENFENVFQSKILCVKKGSNLHIENCTYKPHKVHVVTKKRAKYAN
jgi:hypothetical protein